MMFNDSSKEVLSPEIELALCCARTHIDDKTKAKIQFLIQEGINWEHLIQFAVRHRLINLVYYQISRICLNVVPPALLEDLKNIHEANIKRNLMLTGELFKIYEILKSNDITAIPYKGPLLAFLAYNNLALREFHDLDIFVNKSDVLMVKDLLISNGYRLYHDLDFINSHFYLRTQREYSFINDETGTVIEIHWNFHGAFLSLPEEFKCLYDDLDIFKLNSFSTSSLKTENLILVLCLHCANHDWDSLSWICDIYELISANDVDWQYLMKTADKLGVKRIFLLNISLIMDLWGLKVPEYLLNHISSDKSVNNLGNFIEKKIFFEDGFSFTFPKKAIFDFKKRESRIYGIKDVIRTSLIPTYIDFLDIQLPAFLYPIYYIVRPILLFKRLGFKSVNSDTQNNKSNIKQ